MVAPFVRNGRAHVGAGAANGILGFLSDAPSPSHGTRLFAPFRNERVLKVFTRTLRSVFPDLLEDSAQGIDRWGSELCRGFDRDFFDGVSSVHFIYSSTMAETETKVRKVPLVLLRV